MKKYLFFIIIIFFASCKHKIKTVDRGFYYWKSDAMNFTAKEKQVYDSLNIQKLYVKFFEVDYSNEMGNIPVSKSSLSSCKIFSNTILVPVVYIKNIVFLKSSNEDLDLMAENVIFLINKFHDKEYADVSITEYQIDCDWTLTTKDKYFYFLNKLKTISGKQLSATLRLYPYKYRDKMGIPPVDKLTLMCYNILNPLENPNKNTILDLSELKSYLKNVPKYPKHLDIALPIYSWAQVYHNEQFSNVLYTDTKLLKSIVKQDKPQWYTVTQDTVIKNTYLRVGDKIKYEEIDATTLINAIEILKKHIDFDNTATITLFHLDEEQLINFTNEELTTIYTSFCK